MWRKKSLLSISALAFIVGCGGGGGGSTSISETPSVTSSPSIGVLLDSAVEGVQYSSASYSGYTDSHGYFNYRSGEMTRFNIGNITLGDVIPNNDHVVTPLEIVNTNDINDSRVVDILRALQSLDTDGNPDNGIQIANEKSNALKSATSTNLSETHQQLTDAELANLLDINTSDLVNVENAKSHFQTTLSSRSTNETDLNNENRQDHSDQEENGYNHDGEDSDGDGSDEDSSGGSSGGGTGTGGISTSTYTLLAWNDLGMHCFDGKDFSIFSILPPFNNLNAHLILKDGTSNKHITSGVTITYKALENLGHINTTSSDKTNFWSFVTSLFPGASDTNDTGLTGNKTPSITAESMEYNSTHNWWEATGIPIVSYDDNGAKNFYPMVRVTARDGSNNVLATADVVLPVSDEMDCAKCHASTTSTNPAEIAAKPTAGWVENNDTLKDYKLNILRLHDQNRNTETDQSKIDAYNTAITSLANSGYDYNTSLEQTALNGTPILCATCHKSNALGTSGFSDIKPLTQALHGKHATVIDPNNGLALNASTNRTSCYSCHPGAETECLRGAMGSAKDSNGTQKMQCQSCHGTMSAVGDSAREGWFDQPNCQACHQQGQRFESAVVGNTLRTIVDDKFNMFATNPNTPVNNVSLYRFSTGHGNLQCSACHGSTHAIFPTSHLQDNIISNQIQGHSGTIAECSSCHTSVPNTTTGGPHGMHPVGQSWISGHQHASKTNCATCHSSNRTGTVLAQAWTDRTFSVEHSTKTFQKGDRVTCYSCHNGPNPD